MSVSPGQLRSGYGPIYRYLSRCGGIITPAAKLVLLNILERLGQKGMAWPSQETIAADTGFSEPTVRRALSELSALGLLAKHRRGQGLTNQYFVDVEALLEWAESGNSAGCRTAKSSVHEPTNSSFFFPYKEDPPLKNHQGRDPAPQDAGSGDPLAKRHKPIDEAFIRELQDEHPAVNVRDVYERAQNRRTWDGYKDKRRALRDHIGYALNDRSNGNGTRRNNHSSPDKAAEIAGLAAFDGS